MAYTPVLLLTLCPCQVQQSAEILLVMPRQLAAGTRQLELWTLLRHLSIAVVSLAEGGQLQRLHRLLAVPDWTAADWSSVPKESASSSDPSAC